MNGFDDNGGSECNSSDSGRAADVDNPALNDGNSYDDLEECMVMNQELQNSLHLCIRKLYRMLEINQIEQAEILREKQKSCPILESGFIFKTSGKPVSLFVQPYFRDKKGRIAPDNEETTSNRMKEVIDAYFLPPRPWSRGELAVLTKGVHEVALQQQLGPLYNRIAFYERKRRREVFPDEKDSTVAEIIQNAMTEIEAIRSKSKVELLDSMTMEVDWLVISACYMSGLRTAEECELKWKNLLNAKVNRKKFTSIEDYRLKIYSVKFRRRNWDLTAEKMKSNRTAVQCLERYQLKHNKNLLNKYWSPEEDMQLINVVQSCQVGDHIPWHQVTSYMPGRSRTQILNRWNRTVKPEAQLRPWTKEEDAVLHGAYQKFGDDWMKIAGFLPGRTNYTCRERYRKRLAPNLVSGDWTLEEDCRLLKAVSKHGFGKWIVVGKYFENRTHQSCFQRAACMKKHNLSQYQAALRRAASGSPITEILTKQIVSSKAFPSVNKGRQSEREQARQLFEDTLRRLNPVDQRVKRDMLFSEYALRRVCEELLGDVMQPVGEHFTPSYRAYRQNVQYSDSESEEEHDSDNVESGVDSEEEMSMEEKLDIDQELLDLFTPSAVAGLSKLDKKFVYKSGRIILEYNVTKALVFKAYGLENCDPENSRDFRGVDYMQSIPRVLGMFVLPQNEDNTLSILPPNLSTLSGLLNMFSLQGTLELALKGKWTDQAIHDFRAVCVNTKVGERTCYICQNRTAQGSTSRDCICERIVLLRERFAVFRHRFLGAFLNPAILSIERMSNEQLKKLVGAKYASKQ